MTSAQLSVTDVDSGLGHTGPVITGYFVVSGDPKPVVDDALRRASDVLGQESAGVGIRIAVTDDTGPGNKLGAYGYPDVAHGEKLWDATH